MGKIKLLLLSLLERIELAKRHIVRPEKFIRRKFYRNLGYTLNLDDPSTFNEKLQWLKLYWHHPLLPTLVDKYAVKDYIAKQIGKQYVIPTLGVWNNVDDIDWELLPDQFVLKCTHDSGGLVICSDKRQLDRKEAVKKLKKSMANNYYYNGFEWPYKNVKPRIIAEKYMRDPEADGLPDYKFFCFDGEVKAMFVATERNKKGVEVKFDFYDQDFNHLPFTNGHPNSSKVITRNRGFDEMKELAGKLSKGFPHVRIDFYEIAGKVYFGEMTFYHNAGWIKFDPQEWDRIFGDWLKLPSAKIV